MLKDGIIVSNVSNLYFVEDNSTNDIIKCNARGRLKEQGINPVVGDYVQYEVTDIDRGEGIVEAVLDRSGYIKRPRIANLTQIVFVISMKMPKPDLLMLDKQLAFAEINSIKPIICLNKIDLEEQKNIEFIEKIYKGIGYEVYRTNANSRFGIDKIIEILQDNITAFSGNSGVGKSTLINAIFNSEVTKQGVISHKNKKGKNTTTSTFLYKINKNSYIADTPGFSTFDISEIKSEDLYKYFVEFVAPVNDCEFVGCTHIKEEKCGVKKAIKDGRISINRYNNYCRIYQELKEKEAHRW